MFDRILFSVLCCGCGRNHLRKVLSCCRCRCRCGYFGLTVRLWTLRCFPHFQDVTGVWRLLTVQLLLLRPGEGVRQVDRHEALRQLDGVELGTQRLDDLFPVTVWRQGPPLRAADAVLAVELDIQRIIDVASWADGNADAVVECGIALACGGALWLIGLGFVELEGDV